MREGSAIKYLLRSQNSELRLLESQLIAMEGGGRRWGTAVKLHGVLKLNYFMSHSIKRSIIFPLLQLIVIGLCLLISFN